MPANTPIPLEPGRLQRLRVAGRTPLTLHAYVPTRLQLRDRVLVCVHGINRRARAQALAFRGLAERLGVVLVAPRFDAANHPGYQRPGGDGGPRADLALDRALALVVTCAGLEPEPARLLFGFSGGGQFVHRYAALHPERVAAVAVGAAGWYTLPEPGRRYPHGLGTAGPPAFDLAAWLRIPTAVFVGERDRARGDGFNDGGRQDRQQGATRVDRGRHFVASMRRAARAHGLETPFRFELLPGIGHDFGDAVAACDLPGRVGAFLRSVGALPPARTARPSARHDPGDPARAGLGSPGPRLPAAAAGLPGLPA